MPYGGHAISGAASNVGDGGSTSDQGRYPNRGNSSWQPQQQRGRGGRGRGFTSSPSPSYSNAAVQGNQGGGSSATTRRGGVNMRGRGRGQCGRGRASKTFSSSHSDNYSDYTYFGAEPQHTYSNNTGSMGRGARQFGGATGHGRGAFSTGYSPGARRGHQPNQPWSSSAGPSHMAGVTQPPVSPLTLSADPSHSPFQQPPGQSPSPLFGAPPITPPMAPPPSAPPITSPLHLVPHSPMQMFSSHPPSQSSPTSPWAPPTQPLPPHQHYGHGQDGEQSGSHHHQPYQQRQPMQYGHQQRQHVGGGIGEAHSIAGPSTGQMLSSGTQGQASDVIKALVSNELYTYIKN